MEHLPFRDYPRVFHQRRMAFSTIFTPSSSASSSAADMDANLDCRIMVSKKKNAGPGFDLDEVSRLCEKFGRLAKPVHQPKRMPFSCFVEFETRQSATTALHEIPKSGRFMAFPATPKNGKDGDGKNAAAASNQHLTSNGGGDWLDGSVEKASFSSSPPQQVGFGRCIRCTKPGEYNCERCMDPYCSPECQRAHWPIHKKECIPMPKLVKAGGAASAAAVASQSSSATPTPTNLPPPNRPQLGHTGAPPKAPFKSSGYDSYDREMVVSPNKDSPPNKSNNSYQRPSHDRSRNRDDGHNESATSQNSPPFGSDPPESGSTVAITAILSTNNVYVRSLAQKVDQLYVDLLKDVTDYAQNSEPLQEMPMKGDIVAAEFYGDFYRALVNDARNENRIVLVFLDFGNFETKRLSDLRYLNDDLQRRPRYVRRFILKNVEFVKEGHQAANSYLKQFEDEVTPLKMVYAGPWSRLSAGELIVKSTNESVNDRLRQIISGKPAPKPTKTSAPPQKASSAGPETKPAKEKSSKQQEPEREIITEDHLKFRSLASVGPTEIVVLDNENLEIGLLAVTRTSDKELVDNVNRSVHSYIKYSDDDIEYRPRKDELCLVQVDSAWHRAVCEGFESRNVNLRLLDNGLIVTGVSIIHIRKFPPVMLDHPCVTALVDIQGIGKAEDGEKLSDKLVNRLRRIFDIDSEHKVEKITYCEDEDSYTIHMPKMVNKLRDDGLI